MPPTATRFLGFVVGELLFSAFLAASDFYVSPGGHATWTGGLLTPWDLATALAQPLSVRPGDTIWLRGGTYPGAFVSDLSGDSPCVHPIVLRSYPGEFARLDGASIPSSQSDPGFILTVQGSCAVYRDFEVMSSSNPNPNGGQSIRPEGLQIVGPDNKIVNLVVHDTGQGMGFWEGAPDSEITGCLVYYNGNSALDHGIYTNNLNGTKKINDNIIFRNYGLGLHAYTTNGHLNNFEIERNIAFDNGKLNQSMSYVPNFLLGSGQGAGTSCNSSPQVAQNPKFIDNDSYHPRGAGGREIDLGYSTGSCNPTATGNYLVGDTTLTLGPAFGTITISGNTFYGPVSGFSSGTYPSNTYLSARPTTTQVFVRPNPYEAGRAQIVVYNWANQSAVNVDIGSVLFPGAQFQVRNAQNYFGAPVLSGTYAGGSISLPMTGLTPATPVGLPAPPATGPEFNAFVLIQTAPPPPAPLSFQTVTPCRIVDTRRPTGPLGGPTLAARETRAFVLAGQCGIPSGAAAVSINATVVSPTAGPGFLTIFPGGTPQTQTSTVNYTAGHTRSNNAVIALGPAGDLTVYCGQSSGTANLVIDINGYFR